MAFTKVLPSGISSTATVVFDSINTVGVITASSIVATTGTFSGNLNVAGVLTYEDVTNVDSIGLITARSGIHVTGGSVGIGTDNPTTKLYATDTQNGYVSYTFVNDSNGSGAVNRIQLGNDASPGSAQLVVYGSQHSTLPNVFDINNANNSYMRLLTNNTERLRINSTGNVGIGTTNPQRLLHLYTGDNAQLVLESPDTLNDINLCDINGSARIRNSGGELRFFTGGDPSSINVVNGTTKVAITTTGNLEVYNGNLVFSTSGTGIDFSATANSSGTTSSELLDDYEEGTWTPSAYLSYNPSSRGVSTSNSEGRYIKVGNLVVCYYRFTYTLTGSGSFNLGINNLPFTSKNSAFSYTGGGTAREDQYTGYMFIAESILTNSTVLQVFRRYDNGAPRDPDGNLSGSLSYLTD